MKTFNIPLRQYYDWCKDYPLVIHSFEACDNYAIVQIRISLLKTLLTGSYKVN